MEITILDNYIHTRDLSLDLDQIKKSCGKLENYVKENFKDNTEWYKDLSSPESTNLFKSYNLFLYPLWGFHNLFTDIQSTFHEIRKLNKISHDKFYIQSWVNVYRKGQYIDWHDHWEPQFKAWHGFYCVDVGDSSTTYKLMDNTIIDVRSRDNLLVLSKSDGDLHKSSEWNLDNPRITIAFDIVPDYSINWDSNQNHWIPI
jgi:hypothetical protein